MAVIYPFLKNAFLKAKQLTILELLLVAILITLSIGSFLINSISVILFVLATFYYFQKHPRKTNFTLIAKVLIGFYILFVISLFWTTNIENTKSGLLSFLSYLALPLAFSLVSKNKININKVFSVFSNLLVLCAIYCIFMGALKVLKTGNYNYLFYHELCSNLSILNAIYLSVFVSFGISFLIYKQKKSKLDVFNLTVLALFLILLSSKIIITITLISGVFYLIRKRKFHKVNLKSFLLLIVIISIFIAASSNLTNRIKVEFNKTKINEVLQTKDFGHAYIWTGFGLRVFQAKMFLEVIQENKNTFLGSGLFNSQDTLIKKYKEYNLYPGFYHYNYHNQYIQVYAELGVIGLCMLLLIFILTIKQAIIYKDYFLLSFIILILVVCLTESFLWRQRGMVFFITTLLLLTRRKRLDI